MIGFTLFIDREPTNITAEIFSNGAGEHRAVVPVTAPYTFTIGQHTFALEAATSDTTSDSNDRYYVAALRGVAAIHPVGPGAVVGPAAMLLSCPFSSNPRASRSR